MASDASKILPFLPVGIDVRGKNCLVVVGGGAVGTRKALTLARAGRTRDRIANLLAQGRQSRPQS